MIANARMVMWDIEGDPTGIYGSYIDAQDATAYPTVSSEATTSDTGTLDFKA